jgi:hypothetical protein
MGDWILLNGERVDRAAFEANYAKALEQAWEKAALANDEPIGSCLICAGAVPRGRETIAYRSFAGVLCAPCFERFVGPSTPP